MSQKNKKVKCKVENSEPKLNESFPPISNIFSFPVRNNVKSKNWDDLPLGNQTVSFLLYCKFEYHIQHHQCFTYRGTYDISIVSLLNGGSNLH